MLYTLSEPERLIRPLDSDVAHAVLVLEHAITSTGDIHVALASTVKGKDRAAEKAGAMMDRLARVAEYVERAYSQLSP